jgi:hypothetical protein
MYHGLLHNNTYMSRVIVDNLLHSANFYYSCDKLQVFYLLESLFLHDHLLYRLLCYPKYICIVYYTEVPDCTVAVHYCIVVVLHIVAHCYTVVVIQIVVCYYTVVVLEIVVRYYTVDSTHYYIVDSTQFVFSLNQPAPYMHLRSSPSLSPRLCNPSLHVQLT